MKLSITISPEVLQEDVKSFFQEILSQLQTPPDGLADAGPRKRRVLEVLPAAPSNEQHKVTGLELTQTKESDSHLRENIKWRLGPVLTFLKNKYKKLAKPFEVILHATKVKAKG